eukprot:1869139-Amphidinium_carterae.1
MFDRTDVTNNASTKASYKGRGKITSYIRRPSIAASSASEVTTRPVIRQFAGHATITNFYANTPQAIELPTVQLSKRVQQAQDPHIRPTCTSAELLLVQLLHAQRNQQH